MRDIFDWVEVVLEAAIALFLSTAVISGDIRYPQLLNLTLLDLITDYLRFLVPKCVILHMDVQLLQIRAADYRWQLLVSPEGYLIRRKDPFFPALAKACKKRETKQATCNTGEAKQTLTTCFDLRTCDN